MNDPWNFSVQRFEPLDVQVAPGDTIETRCQWNNTTPNTVAPAGGTAASSDNVRLYPHCKNCANKQGGVMNQMSTQAKIDKGQAVMAANAPPPPKPPS